MTKKIPEHVVIIPDGNRRWAKSKGLLASEGHVKSASYDNLKGILNGARESGVKYLSMWGFSTENWKRSDKEKKVLFSLLGDLLDKLLIDAKKNRICVRHLGRKDRLPKELIEKLNNLERETKSYNDFYFQLCLDYGGRDEIIRAVIKLVSEGKKDINEIEFLDYLDSSGLPEPDLIIRTSGEKRLSGIMPYQSAYAELCFVDKPFPEFKGEDLKEAVREFGRKNRRFGGD